MSCYGSMVVRSQWGEPIEVPCGQCIGCRLEKARQWAVRCVHEASMYEENCFLTLTYNNENLPADGCIHKSHLQWFFKRLRYHFQDENIRYYACGEYGEVCVNCGLSRPVCYREGCRHFTPTFGRPHYHACVFGFNFHDREIHRGPKSPNHPESVLYRSPTLEKIWNKGFSTIGDVTFESAGYVARYTMKKITGEKADEHYSGKVPEFALMSRRPGIGKPWFDKYFTDVYPKDFFTLNGVKQKPPRYYDSLLEQRDPVLYDQIKDRRSQNVREEDSLRKYQLSEHRKSITKSLNRSYENE